MAEQLLKTGTVHEEMLKQVNIKNARKEIGCKLLMNSGIILYEKITCVNGPNVCS